MKIKLDDRFTITAIEWCDGYSWNLHDDAGDYHYEAQEPAKDQTTVMLLAAEIIRERY